MGYTGEFNMSVSKRFDLLKELNKAKANGENIELSDEKAIESPPTPSGPQPESIEEQINTSITETLKALSPTDAPPPAADEPNDKKSGKRLGRSKRSS